MRYFSHETLTAQELDAAAIRLDELEADALRSTLRKQVDEFGRGYLLREIEGQTVKQRSTQLSTHTSPLRMPSWGRMLRAMVSLSIWLEGRYFTECRPALASAKEAS